MSDRVEDAPGPGRGPLCFTLLLVLLVASPALQNASALWGAEPEDGFPLSYFPMFTTDRKGRTNLNHVVGIRADGSEVNLSYRVVGSGGMNQVRRQINRYVREDRLDELCERVLRRVEKRGVARKEKLVAFWIVRDRYEFDSFFSGERTPARRRVLAKRDLPTKEEP